jgi:hypothetical protein
MQWDNPTKTSIYILATLHIETPQNWDTISYKLAQTKWSQKDDKQIVEADNAVTARRWNGYDETYAEYEFGYSDGYEFGYVDGDEFGHSEESRRRSLQGAYIAKVWNR